MTQPRTAPKEKHRRIDWIERIGEATGNHLGQGRLRAWLRDLYRKFLLLRSGGRGLRCSLPGGESMRVLPAYRFAAWSQLEYEAFKAVARPGGVALDVGANIGTYSVLLGQWVGAGGKVFAFEPAPETFAALSRHIAMNDLENVVFPQRHAVSDRTATLHFLAANFQGTNRLMSEQEAATAAPADVQRVETVTIDQFCAQHNIQPDFIKIDIEGFELSALRGARETIKNRRGQLALFVEMHPTTWQRLGLSRDDMLAELAAQCLHAQPLVEDKDPWQIEGVCMRLLPS